MDKLPLAIALIARNEQRSLPRMLESVAGMYSELVAVVNDCTDSTEDILAAHSAKIINEPWVGFATQKNIALDHCAQEWVLCLDADEALSEGLRAEIADFVKNDGHGRDAASFPRMARFMGRWIRRGDWYPDRQLRLVRRGSARWGGGEIHERLIMGEGSKGVRRLKGDLLHYTSEDTQMQFLKIAPYSRLFLKEKSGKKCGGAAIALRACWRFFRGYFLRLGFLDGFAGFYIASMNAFGTLHKYALLHDENRRKSIELTKNPSQTP